MSKLYKAIKGCGAAMKIIEASGENELTLAAELHPGVLSKGRLDIRRKTLIADIKTTSATDREDFLDHVYKYGYNSSHAYYHDLYEKLAEPLPFVWICASKTTEQAWVTMAPGQSYHSGRYWYQSALNIYSRARKAGVIL